MTETRHIDSNDQHVPNSSLALLRASTPDSRLSRRQLLAGLVSGTAAIAVAGLPRSTLAERPATPLATAFSYPADVAMDWFQLALKLVEETPGFSPPVASRAFGYMGVALYEALVPGLPGYRSLAGQINELSYPSPPIHLAYHWPTVANSALATIIRNLLPVASSANLAGVASLESAYASAFEAGVPKGIYKRSEKRGVSVASHIFNWSMSDGGHAGYLSNFPATYLPPTGPGLWEPTPPSFQPALQPFWGNNRPFVLASGDEVDPGPPSPYSDSPASAIYSQAIEVYDAVNNLTPEQLEIARFWSDDPGVTSTPPGHSVSIMTQTLQLRGSDLGLAAQAYAMVGMAVADAFIACWNTKYRYNLLRPITYIQQAIGPGWGNPLPLVTPPFPEYTSGHSVQTGAMAHVLFDLFGDFPFTDHTHDDRGFAPRTFTSCAQIAEEAAISRLYGGIHFRPAIDIGIEQGKAIGQRVSALTFKTPP